MWLYTFHMPLFMLLAGINVPSTLAKGRSTFLRSKMATVVYPYILWSIIQGSILVMLSNLTNGQVQWVSLLKIGWQPISPFWFLYALFAFMFLVSLIRQKIALVTIAVLGQIASAFLLGGSLLHQLCYQFVFFLIGVLASERIKRLDFAWYLTLVFLAAWIAAVQIIPRDERTPYLTPIALPAALAGIAMIFALSQLLRGRLLVSFSLLGQASMAIYVMHILATAGTRIAATSTHLPISEPGLWLACTVAGIVEPLLAWLVLKQLGILHWFGLSRWPHAKPDRSNSGH